jgi:uncharacterized protein (DUF362 family)
MNFNLCIADAFIVSGIAPRRLGLFMASTDPVSIDAAAAEILRLKPNSVRHILLAQKEGLGRISHVSKGYDRKYFIERYPAKDSKNKISVGLSSLLNATYGKIRNRSMV